MPRIVPAGTGGSEALLWKACKKKEFRLPAIWERVAYKQGGTMRHWFSDLRKDKKYPLVDLFALDRRAPQNGRLYKVQLPEVEWKKDGVDVPYLGAILNY